MRTPLVAGLLALALQGCIAGEITDVGGEDGEPKGDGSGLGSGSGSGTLTPRLTASLDRTSITTENGKAETVTVTLTSVDGFTGNVVLTGSVADGASAAIPNVTFDGPGSVTVPADGNATATFTITIPSNATGAVMTGSLKLTLASALGNQDVTSPVTINNFYTVDYPTGTGGTASTHPNAGMDITIKRGTIIKFANSDNTAHIIHGGGPFPHESQTAGVDGLPGRTYEVETIGMGPGNSGTMGCHSHGSASYATYIIQ